VIHYQCPRCKKPLTAQDNVAGVKINCPQCKQRLQVPAPPPPNKTMLGTLDDQAGKTILGKLEGQHPETAPSSEGYAGAPPPVRRTIIVDAPPPLAEAASDPSEESEIPEVEPVRPRRRRRYEEDDEDDRPRRRLRSRSACPRCGCTDYQRQTTKFGTASIVLLVFGIIFWPLLIIAFALQEKWDVCPDCGEKLRQTGTGF
jgi:DNA-directed RNA polymerase subunit RPC12/RpoP